MRRATAVRGGREASSWVRVGQVQEPVRRDAAGVVAGAEDADGDGSMVDEGGGGGREEANSMAAGVSRTCWGDEGDDDDGGGGGGHDDGCGGTD